jgi:gliding motility-associated-like protein
MVRALSPLKNMKTLLLYILLLSTPFVLRAQLRINEVSQGSGGTQEYAEMVVVGTRTCSDSCADLRNWIIDDNNGWLGAGTGQGIASGCLRFANDPAWSCVPYGSIILVYNDGDHNPSITQPDDPTDANHDHVYIVPASSIYLERNSSSPVSPSMLNYVYPTTGFTAGGSWSSMGLNNSGDAFIVTSPADLTSAYHSFGYGNLTNAPAADIFIATSGYGKVYYLTNDQYNNVADWAVGNAPTDETPGAPNDAANATWINGMLTPVTGMVDTDIYACVTQGHSYFFNNQNLTVAGVYNDTLATVSGCDSIIRLHLNVVLPSTHDTTISSCHTIVYLGNPYSTSTDLHDTVHSYQGCDSIYSTVHIVIQGATPVFINDTLRGCGHVIYNSTDYTSNTFIGDTLQTIAGCDSAFIGTYIIVDNIQPVIASDTFTGCRGLVVNNQVYDTTTITADTLRTAQGCDSVYRNLTVIILQPDAITITPADTAICPGRSVTLRVAGTSDIAWLGFTAPDSLIVKPDSTTIYRAVGTSANGCTDTASAIVTVENFVLNLFASPDTAALTDEVFSLETSGNFPYEVTLWYPQYLFPHQHVYSQQLVADETRKYTVIAQSKAAGCKDTATIIVTVKPDPYTLMPNAFTPNDDGLNDFILPMSDKPFTVRKFIIFNHWGNEVYDYATGDKRGWNGYYKGVQCPESVYAYYLIVDFANGNTLERKGNITLLQSHL